MESPAAGGSATAGAAGGGRAPVKRSFLPPFADERNRQLDKEIRELEAQLEQANVGVEENREHIKVLAEHLDAVRLEIKHAQGHLTARTQEVATEGHLRELSSREAGRLRAEAAKLARQRGEQEQRATALQAEVLTAQERLDQYKLLMNWNQEELEQWGAAAKAKEDDALALERYHRADETRVKELGMALERVTREAAAAARELDEEITETRAAQGALGKAADDFRRLHAERQELLAQWEAVLAAVTRRDAEIRAAGEALAERRAEMAALRGELASAAAALEGQAAACATQRKQIAARERGNKRAYDTFAAEQSVAAEAEDALDLLTNDAAHVAEQAAQQGAANGHLRADVARRAVALEMAQQDLAATRRRLEQEGAAVDSMQARLEELEGLRQQERAKADALDKQLAALAKQQFRAAQELHTAQEEQRRLEGELGGARAQGRSLSHRLAQLEEHMVRQREVLYNVDFQLVQMERKVARAAGERTKDETEALNARIAALSTALEVARAEQAMLVEQVKRADDDHARALRANAVISKERAAVLDVMARLEVESDATARAAKAATKEKEERLVEVDVWKLEVRRLRGLLNSKSGEVTSLEHRKRSMELGMAERRSEVAVQMELMQGEARLLRDDLSRVTKELKERQLALEKLQAKHATLVLKGRGSEGEGLQSQAYYIVKAAQERQELSEEADALGAAVDKAEKECRALEATLQRVAACNQEMNQHYRFNASQELADQHAAAKAALEAAMQRLRERRGDEAAARASLEEAAARLANAQAEEAHVRRLVEDLEAQKAEAERQLAEQRERQARAAQRTDRLRRQLLAKRPSSGAGGPCGAGGSARPSTAGRLATIGALGTSSQPGTARGVPPVGAASLAYVEADVALALLRESTKGMVDALRALAAEHPELQVVQRIEAAAGVKLSAEGSARLGCAADGGSRANSVWGGSRPGTAARSSAAASARGSGSPSRPGSSASSCIAAATSRSAGSGASPAAKTVQLQL
eukprot:scaffold14.g1108.t1